MPNAKFSAAEAAAIGEAIYERDIRSQVESQHQGQFLVLDIDSGEYEIAPDDLVATKRILNKHPEAVLHGLRIGSRVAYRLGGFSQAVAR